MKPNRRNPLFANIFRGNTLTTAVVVSLSGMASLFPDHAAAADIVWGTNLAAGPWDWNTGANWTGGTAPTVNTNRGDLRKDWTAAATINFSAATTVNGILFDDTGATGDVGVTLGNGGTAANTLTLAGTSPGVSVIGSLNVSAVMAGSTAWAKSGAGTLILSNTANSYTAATSVSAGELQALYSGTTAATYTNLGTGTGAIINVTSATLRFKTGSTANAIGWANPINLNTSTLIHEDGSQTLSGAIGLTGANTINGIFGGKNLTLSGIISGTGSITKTNAASNATVVTLSNANTYTGSTSVTAGVLRLSNATALPGGIGAAGGVANLSLNGGQVGLANGDFSRGLGTGATQVQLAGTSGFAAYGAVRTVNFGGANAPLVWGSGSFAPTTLLLSSAIANVTADNNLVISNPIDLGASARTVQVDNGTATVDAQFSGVVSGSGQLLKTGTGTLALSAANTFSTGIGFRAGAVQFNSNDSASTPDISFIAADAGRITLSAGVALLKNVNIASGVAGSTGLGLIGQAGTGQVSYNGAINVTAGPGAGGVVGGSNTVGNEIIINGPINGNGFSQRDGRVIYVGGGNATGTFTSTGTVLLGANNGIPTGLILNPGGSGATLLDLNGFNQTSPGLTLGNGTTVNATVNLGAKTLTLTGNLTSQGTTIANTINATSGSGTLALGAVNRSFTVADSSVADDLTLNNVTITGSGGFTKLGAGNLAFNNTTATSPFTLSTGSIAVGTSLSTGTAAFSSLALTGGTINMDIGAASDLITAGALTTTGTTTFNLSQLGGVPPTGPITLISYSGASPGTANLAVTTGAHFSGNLVDTGSAINFMVTASDTIYWTGVSSTAWATGSTGNWNVTSTNAVTDFFTTDEVIFPDSPTTSAVAVAANVSPSKITFTNTTATTYSFTGAGGIAGVTGLTKNNNGTVTLATPNSYTGATAINAGTLELDHDATGNVVLSGTSGISIASGAKLYLSRDDGDFTLNRNVSGAGSIDINPHSVAGTTTSRAVFLTGTNTGFSGSLTLKAPSTGTYRLQTPTQAALGTSTIDVKAGTQLFLNAGTFGNNLTISGTGYAEAGTSGSIGSLRLDASTLTGNVNIDTSARIGAHNSTSTISGVISGGNLEVNATNFNNSYTLIFTGSNTYGTTTIGGQNVQVVGVPSMRLNIGNGGTSGSLGAGAVTINGDGANGVLGFDRSDGYTLGQTITGAGSNIARTFIDIDTRGLGFSQNGNAITLGTAAAAGTSGGLFRVGQARAGSIANLNGNLTVGQFFAGSATLSTTNLNSGASVTTGILHVGRTGASGSVININTGSSLTVNGVFNLGEQAAGSFGTASQSGGAVSVGDQMRIGHWGSETSTYSLSGGTLSLTAAAPGSSPSGTGEVSGGVYVGVDGTATFNQSGGTLSTNYLVLDNRGDSVAGAGQPDGIDRYNLSNGTLELKSVWGLIARNPSTAVSLTGGTIKNTGSGIDVAINAPATVANTVTLDTNGAGNKFSLMNDLLGSGTLALTGGGSIELEPDSNAQRTGSSTGTGFQTISAPLSGSLAISKVGTGTTTLTGSGAGYTGNVTVNGGRLNVPTSLAAGSVTVADGASLSGEPTVTNLTVGSAGGATVYFDPGTGGAITTTNLTVNGSNYLDVTSIPAAGTKTAISYTTNLGTGTFQVADAANYRGTPTVVDTGTSIDVTFVAGKSIVWTGATNGNWNINNDTNWNDSVPNPEKFFSGDFVEFPEGGANATIALSGLLTPSSVTVSSATTNYTFTSSSGNQIFGATGLTKTGGSTLTLAGDNGYTGATSIGGGMVSISGTNSIGTGAPGNNLSLSGGGRLAYTGTTALDLGSNRSVTVGTGGGSLVHNSATATTLTVSGAISGSEPLSIQSMGAGGGTFSLTGSNSGYTGAISVDSLSTGLTSLRFYNQASVPAASSISLNHPPLGAAAGNATTLDLLGVTLPVGTTIYMTNGFNGANSMRTQIVSNGDTTINGPIKLSGAGSIVQIPCNSGTLTLNGNISEASTGSFAGNTFFPRGNFAIVINGNIILPGATVAHTETGTLTINSTGNVWATTSLNVGSIVLGANDALCPTAPIALGQNDAGVVTLNMAGFNQTVAGLSTNPTALGANTTGKTITSATAATLTVNQGVDNSYAGNITGALTFVKSGASSLTLSGTNSYTGPTTVNAGTLRIQGTLRNTPSVTVTPGTVFQTAATNIFVADHGTAVDVSRLITVNSAAWTMESGETRIGNVTLSNGSTWTSNVNSPFGVLLANNSAGASTVTVSGSGAVLMNGSGGLRLQGIQNFDVADVTGSAATDLTVSMMLQAPGSSGGAPGGINKTGAGTMLLSAVNDYNGTTTVSNGKLVVNGSVYGGASVALGATLGGSGTVYGPGSVAGTVAPGNSVGTLNFGTNLDLSASSTYAVEIGGAASNDKLNVSGALTANGVIAVTLVGYTPVAGNTFDIADAASISGTPAFDFSAAVLSSGLAWDTSSFATNGTITVIVSDPFDIWATLNGVTGGKAGDDDGDGVLNIVEFATNSDAKNGSSGARVFSKMHVLGGENVLTYTVAVRKSAVFAAGSPDASKQEATKDAVKYIIEASNEVGVWNTVVVTELNSTDSSAVQSAITPALPGLGADWEWHSFRTDGGAPLDPTDFIRLKVEY